MRRRSVLAVAAVLALGAPACAGSGGDKAGGAEAEPVAQTVAKPVGKPVTLTLVTVDETWASEFAAAAARLSGGSIRIETRIGGGAILDYERSLVGDVRKGKAELVGVGARAWDRMGVTSFQALVAPFLVDSLEHQRRILTGPRVAKMLESLEPLGLVGLAVLPGVIRRPLGVSRPLLGPRDYRGATVGIRFGGVAQETLRALGATYKAYRIGALGRIDGAELDLATIVNNGYDGPARTLTANVVLWSRPETIAIGREAFGRLGRAQQQILRRAGRETVGPMLARIEKEQKDALDTLCDRGSLSFVTASPAEVAALRRAVRPVYAELERDAQTRKLIAEIRRLDDGAATEPLRCSGSEAAAGPEGAWEANVTRAAMLASGASPAEAATYGGSGTLELKDGRWSLRGERATVTGTYAVEGESIRLTMQTCTANPCEPSASTDYAWSVYGDTLTLEPQPGRPFWPRLVAGPARRVG